jgi:uncharacterized SAM-binding protein YcdF (DUF218 family)
VTRRVVAVLGYSRRGSNGLHPICAQRLEHAQTLAHGAEAVILSGLPEAELMRASWTGPEVELLVDADARSTAENARNIAEDARELGAQELVVVTSPWHRRRVAVLMRRALAGSGIELSVAAPEGKRPRLLLARELACFAVLPVQLARTKSKRPSRRPLTTRQL